jgi:signal transduction histidine kinase
MAQAGLFITPGIIYSLVTRKADPVAPAAGPSREELRRLSEIKSRFLNMAAHELNTPITPMRLQLHLLRSGVLGAVGEAQEKALRILERNLDRLASLVQEILDVARLEGGGLRTKPEPLALDDLVKEAVESFEEPAHRVGLSLAPPSSSHAVVMADRNRTLQILFNLLSNAIKFTPAPGEVRVNVSSHDGKAFVTVADTGLGMDATQSQALFQPFARLHEHSAAAAGGTGLGLFISRGLAEAMGGALTAESAGKGKGSTFRLVMPLAGVKAVPAIAHSVEEDALARRLRELI